MKKLKVLTAATMLTASLFSISVAEEAAFWGYNSWHAGKASAVCINKHPEKFLEKYGYSYYGCEVDIKPGGGSKTPERWYTIASGTDDVDTKLWYQDENGDWQDLHDDVDFPSNRNFSAVIHVPQRFTNEAASKVIKLMAGYYGYDKKDDYWFGVSQYETSDPQISGVPYLEVAPDGSMSITNK